MMPSEEKEQKQVLDNIIIYINMPNYMLSQIGKADLMVEWLRSRNPDLARHKCQFSLQYPQ
jgi:hypothetical protein